MKKLIYIFVLTLVMISCSSDDELGFNDSELIGKWNWTSTEGGINGDINKTPATTGKTIHLSFMTDQKFSITENGNAISNGTYDLSMKKSIYSGRTERYIEFKTVGNPHTFVRSGIIKIDQNQTLLISDNNLDGFQSKFKRFQ